jgi:hypothetical protein
LIAEFISHKTNPKEWGETAAFKPGIGAQNTPPAADRSQE